MRRYADRLSQSSGNVRDAFVHNTITILTRAIIPNPDLRDTLEKLEDGAVSVGPFSHISKMLVCAQTAGTAVLILWCFCH